MRYYHAVAVTFLLLSSLIIGIVSRANNVEKLPMIPILLLFFMLVYIFDIVASRLERSAFEYAKKRLIYMGRGLPTRMVKIQVILIEIGVLGLVSIIAYLILKGARIDSGFMLPLLAVTFITIIVVSAFAVRLTGSLSVSSRKTNVEVEFPFLLALINTLSGTHLSLYDLLNIIEDSMALRAWSREVKLAKRLSLAMNVSLLQAMSVISDSHPSPLVRDVFKRIVVVGNLSGSIREVANRAFLYVNAKLQARLESLIDKLNIINGMLLFGFLFLPILIATISPLANLTPLHVAVVLLVVEAPLTILVYVLLTSIYPTGFSVKPPLYTVAVSALSLIGFLALTIITLLPIFQYYLTPTTALLEGTSPNLLIPRALYFIIGLLLLVPPALMDIILYRKVSTYSKLIDVATDVAEISSAMGTNFVTLLTRESHRYGADFSRFVRRIVRSYQSPILRKLEVSKSPTIFHASFIEALLQALLLGSPPQVMASLTSSYEALKRAWEKAKSVSRTLELMIISMSAVLGFFITYIYKIFVGLANIIENANTGALLFSGPTLLNINPDVFISMIPLTGLTITTVAIFTGKSRGGSLIFGFRTALVAFALYAITVEAVDRLVKGVDIALG